MSELSTPVPPTLTSRRPQFHYTPVEGWLNDAHGVVFHEGRYHLFHQAVPGSTTWSPEIRWGHATSPDLVHWTAQPTALEPAADEVGCWTGSICIGDDDQPLMFYSSVQQPDVDVAAIRTALPSDSSWNSWSNGERVDLPMNPAFREQIGVFRDPSVRREGGQWRMAVGAGYRDGRPAVLSWTSPDLATWSFDGEMAVGVLRTGGPWLGTAWECPHLVAVDGHDVLLVGSWKDGVTGEVLAAVGSLNGGRFKGTDWTQVTHGGGHYAPTVFHDRDGHPCVIFWIRGVADLKRGWSGALSVPYRLSVVDGALHFEPHPNVKQAMQAETAPASSRYLEVEEVPTTVGTGLDVTIGRDELVVNVAPSTHLRVPSPRDQPATAVHVIIDGPVLEACTGTSLAGMQIPPLAMSQQDEFS